MRGLVLGDLTAGLVEKHPVRRFAESHRPDDACQPVRNVDRPACGAALRDPKTIRCQAAPSQFRADPLQVGLLDVQDDLPLFQVDVAHLEELKLLESEATFAHEHDKVHGLRIEVLRGNLDDGVHLIRIGWLAAAIRDAASDRVLPGGRLRPDLGRA